MGLSFYRISFARNMHHASLKDSIPRLLASSPVATCMEPSEVRRQPNGCLPHSALPLPLAIPHQGAPPTTSAPAAEPGSVARERVNCIPRDFPPLSAPMGTFRMNSKLARAAEAAAGRCPSGGRKGKMNFRQVSGVATGLSPSSPPLVIYDSATSGRPS